MRLTHADGSELTLHDGTGQLSERAESHQRLPGGHPEGFIEAFANLYRNVANTVDTRSGRSEDQPYASDFPTVQDGARGVSFILNAVQSGRLGEWVRADYTPPS